MSVMLRTQRDGTTLRPYWYGEYRGGNGNRKVINLNVQWKGSPPVSGSMRDPGDEAFERSRERAAAELARFVDETRRKGRAEALTEKLIESKTGRAVRYTRLNELPERWRNLARETEPTEAHLAACDMRLHKFVSFMQDRNPAVINLYEVTDADASAYVKHCRTTFAPATARETIHIATRAMERYLPVGSANPFASFVSRRGNGDKGTIHRQPFTPDELRALMDAAHDDTFMYPLVVCAAMTGMRRGDVCKLTWENVDLPGGMVCVKTSKTDKAVEIPVFPMLRAVLESAGVKSKGYVWPEAARMLKENPDGLTWRFKKIVVRVMSGDPPALSNITPAGEIESEALKAIRRNVPVGERRDRILDVFKRYAAGESVRQIEKAVGCARATTSADLHAIQSWTGKTFMRHNGNRADVKEAMTRLTTVERKQGQRAASVRDWHALRATWVTLALSAGVPIELVKRVTGHAQVEIVLGNYYRPDREHFRAALANTLPDVLTGEKTQHLTVGDELAELIGKVQVGTVTEADKKRLRLLAAKV